MLTLIFLTKTIIDIYVMLLLLRIWMQWIHNDFCNPFAQSIIKFTQLFVSPLRKILPSLGVIDTASLLLVFLLITIKYPLLLLIQEKSIVLNPYNLLLSIISLIKAVGHLIFWMMTIRTLMSWISQGYSSIDYLLYQLTEPLIIPIRCIIPLINGIDFSPIIVILILYTINYLGIDLLGELWLAL
ncbi:YggT family protein [Candidatus Fukatsuia anoeciicola]|uniref:YggT family protein n=1 Tax=Candidatus Fukatsuia anoeciicola TaxID=2994492 RepID=UPI003464105A